MEVWSHIIAVRQDDDIHLCSLLSVVQSRHYLRIDLLLVHFTLYQWLTFVLL